MPTVMETIFATLWQELFYMTVLQNTGKYGVFLHLQKTNQRLVVAARKVWC